MRLKIRRSGPSGGKAHSACRPTSSTDDGHVRCTVARRSSAIAPENQRPHHARHLATSDRISTPNLSAIDMIREAYKRGVSDGTFRAGIEAIDIHLTISALAFYNVSNRASIQQVFGHDMGAPEALARRRAAAIDTVLRTLRR